MDKRNLDLLDRWEVMSYTAGQRAVAGIIDSLENDPIIPDADEFIRGLRDDIDLIRRALRSRTEQKLRP